MARRKYRGDAVSTAGHSEATPPPAAADESLAQPLSPRDEYGKAEPDAAPEQPAQHYDASNLKAQIDAQRRYAEQHAVHQYIAAHFPGAMAHEAQWLMANPHYLSNPPLVHAAGRIALERGIARQSPEFLRAIAMLIDQHHAAMQAQAAPPPAPPMPPMPPPVAHAHDDIDGDHDGERETDMSAMTSAPVSRGEASHSIEPELLPSKITLTKAQREHAAAAGVSDVEYAKQLLKMGRMRKAGLLKD